MQRHGWIVRKGAWLSAPRDRGVPGSAVSNGKLTRQTGRGAKWKCLIARPDPRWVRDGSCLPKSWRITAIWTKFSRSDFPGQYGAAEYASTAGHEGGLSKLARQRTTDATTLARIWLGRAGAKTQSGMNSRAIGFWMFVKGKRLDPQGCF